MQNRNIAIGIGSRLVLYHDGSARPVGSMEERTLEDLSRIVGAIAPEYSMVRVYLFGSRARRDNRLDSDYDFFVVPSEDCGLFKLAGFFSRLEDALGDVDVVCYDPAEKDGFIQRISEDMVLIYESVA